MTPAPFLQALIATGPMLLLAAALGAAGAWLWRAGRIQSALAAATFAVASVAAAAATPLAARLEDLVRDAERAAEAHAPSAEDLVAAAERQRSRHQDTARVLAEGAPGRLPEGFQSLSDTDFAVGENTPLGDDRGPLGVVYIAVSFSMPPADLRRLARDAQAAGAVVVIRGLVRGSFKATALAARQVFDESSLGGVTIDPNVFRAFDVRAAPTFIAATAPVEPCARGLDCIPPAPPHERVTGNITLEAALRILSQGEAAGDVAARAATHLGP